MAISTVKKSSKTKEATTFLTTKEKISRLREHQQPLFEFLNIPKAFYQPKMKYKQEVVNTEAVTFFPAEIENGVDIYTEFVSRDYLSEDKTRQLYVWRYNPNYKQDLRITIPDSTGKYRFIVPVSELEKVDRPILVDSPNQTEMKLDEPIGEVLDIPIKDMTVRDYAAIIWKKPVSTKEWINKLVTEIKQ